MAGDLILIICLLRGITSLDQCVIIFRVISITQAINKEEIFTTLSATLSV